jgi:hypothetical protein
MEESEINDHGARTPADPPGRLPSLKPGATFFTTYAAQRRKNHVDPDPRNRSTEKDLPRNPIRTQSDAGRMPRFRLHGLGASAEEQRRAARPRLLRETLWEAEGWVMFAPYVEPWFKWAGYWLEWIGFAACIVGAAFCFWMFLYAKGKK